MKKTISLLLVLVLCLSLCGCGAEKMSKTTEAPAVETFIIKMTEEPAIETFMIETTELPTDTDTTYSVGEKICGENFELTVKSVEFTDYLEKDNTTRYFQRDVGWEKPEDGKVYTIIKFDYTNLAKRETNMVRDVKFTVIYKDGYEYASFNEEKAYLFEDDINGVFRSCWYDGGYVMDLSPLTGDSYFIAIPVAEIVSKDAESPIQIRVDYGKNIMGGESISETVYIQVR